MLDRCRVAAAAAVTVISIAVVLGGCGLQDDPEPAAYRAQAMRRAAERSLDLLARQTGLGRTCDHHGLQVTRVDKDPAQATHVRIRQTYRGVPVFGAEAIVHLASDGSLSGITDQLVRGVNVSPVPSLSHQRAIELALGRGGCAGCLDSTPGADLGVLRKDGRDRLVYRVQLQRPSDRAGEIFVDAHSGDVVASGG